jgi:hypothetical protein
VRHGRCELNVAETRYADIEDEIINLCESVYSSIVIRYAQKRSESWNVTLFFRLFREVVGVSSYVASIVNG